MIVSSDHFNNSSETKSITMNCGLQYDTRHPSLFSGGLNMESSWMSHHSLQTNVKQEPGDDNFEFPKKDQSVGFTSPLTPPGINVASPRMNVASPTGMNMSFAGYPTPQSDYPSVSSPSGAFSKRGPSGVQDATPRSDGKSSPRLTPPGSIPSPLAMDISDKQDNHEGSQSSNSENEFYENGDSLRRLQMAMQRTGMMPEEKLQCPMCDFSCHVRSQFNEHLVSHETKCVHCDFEGESAEKLREHLKTVHDCEDEMWMEEEPGLKIPKVNSQGKVKTFRCKQCEFSAITKLEFWEHSRSHIKQERLLTCPKCRFVTEYKHHLEYHLRNHFGSKPFKCDKCSYSCVNKSMLNSHLKSHSNVYQFRCSDCTYATKYCHSLKLHLRKYNHNPAMVLNPDGSPNPLPIVDVYGTKRGPKQKPKSTPEKPTQSQQPPVTPQPAGPIPGINFTALNFNPFNLLPTQMPYYNVLNGFPTFPFSPDLRVEEKNNNVEKLPDVAIPEVVMEDEELKDDLKAPLDLTCSNDKTDSDVPNQIEAPISKSRRKGKAFKFERIPRRSSSDEEPEQIVTKPDFPYPEDSKSPDIKSCEADSEQQKLEKDKPADYTCVHCDITFKDPVMYSMHQGYHKLQDPFTCNMCGQQTTDKFSFFLHIARVSHS